MQFLLFRDLANADVGQNSMKTLITIAGQSDIISATQWRKLTVTEQKNEIQGLLRNPWCQARCERG